jgi:hypothetical protein
MYFEEVHFGMSGIVSVWCLKMELYGESTGAADSQKLPGHIGRNALSNSWPRRLCGHSVIETNAGQKRTARQFFPGAACSNSRAWLLQLRRFRPGC